MKKFEVTVAATDWCGYEETFTIEADNENQAHELGEEEFILYWDLVQDDKSGNYGELLGDFDDEGEPLDEADLTGIIILNVKQI